MPDLNDAAPLAAYFADSSVLDRWILEGEHRLRDVSGVIRDALNALLPVYAGPLAAGLAMPRRDGRATGYGPWFVALDGYPYLRARLAAKCTGVPNFSYADDVCVSLLTQYINDPIGTLGPYPDGWIP